jgi:acyl-CoA reductase-like NAD-dependent aldehyde dehydrogenase
MFEVSRRHFPALLEELIAAGEELVWGDPQDLATDIGPVISLAKRDETSTLVARALEDSNVHTVYLLRGTRSRAVGKCWSLRAACHPLQ